MSRFFFKYGMLVAFIFLPTKVIADEKTNSLEPNQTSTTIEPEQANRAKATKKHLNSIEFSDNGDYLSAIPLLEEAYTLDSLDFDIQFSLLTAYKSTYQMEKAIEFLDKLIESSEDKYQKAIWLMQLGITWEELGHKKESRKAYSKSISLSESDYTQNLLDRLDSKFSKDEKSSIESILFLGNINESSIKQLIEAVNNAISNSPSRIDLYISSGGGNVNSSLVAYNYIKSIPVKVRTINMSEVSSAANTIFCAGSERIAIAHSYFLFHRVIYGSLRKGSSLSDIEVDRIQPGKMEENITKQAIKSCIPRLSMSSIDDYYDDGKVLSAKDAKKLGYIQEISEPNFDLHDIKVVPKPK